MNTLAISTLANIPLTPETRERLRAAGVQEGPLGELTEMGGQNLLALRVSMELEDGDPPGCYRKHYDPKAALCAGCVFQPMCWPHDATYLMQLVDGTVAPPSGVPPMIVEQRLIQARALKSIPAPPKEKSVKHAKARERWDALRALGYEPNQINRMLDKVKDKIITERIDAARVSITPKGELRVIHPPQEGEPDMASIAETWTPVRVKLPPSLGSGTSEGYVNPTKPPAWVAAERSDEMRHLYGLEPTGQGAYWSDLILGQLGTRCLPAELITMPNGQTMATQLKPQSAPKRAAPPPPPPTTAAKKAPPPPPPTRTAPPPPPSTSAKKVPPPPPSKV